ncbi:hypothetical protein GCM10008023_19880 [Sphingomonas glacialis]|uniref:DNA-binding protein n=2 Tax=Sphingomonas glacialis TaxID=658225 RepID=A0ABQ3LI81_9SPHN|nr:hypothetical protein GCM10008023_19880 [Sphingomonas glacialis]
MKAAQVVEAAGIEDAQTIIADFAAAGLVKAYALAIETIDATGNSASFRGATVPVDFWQRLILDSIVADVWVSGTFRLAGSELIGGAPAAVVTGITFNAKHIEWLIAHHEGTPIARRRKRKAKGAPKPAAARPVDEVVVDVADVRPLRRKADPAAIPPGALLASMEQTMQALNKSRGTIYNLIEQGKLTRKETGLRSVSIEVASIRAFAGQIQN